MKSYIMNILAAVLVSVFSEVVLPDKWSKYIKIITGLIIISTIIAPIKEFRNTTIKNYTYESENHTFEGEKYSSALIKEELSKRLNEDIKTRIQNEFKISVDAKTTISVNNENQIDGILKIELIGENIGQNIINKLKEIYAPKEVSVNGF